MRRRMVMKKLQKIFSLLLALSMLVCLLSVGVFAEGNDTLTADLTSAQAELDAAQKALTQAQAGYDAAVAAVDKSAVTAAQASVAAAQTKVAAANGALAQKTIDSISEISKSGFENNYKTKTAEQKAAVTAARAAYNALPQSAREYVSNYSDLTTAEQFADGHSYDGTSKWDAAYPESLEPTTKGMQVAVDAKNKTITYTIPEDFSASAININAMQDAIEALNGLYVPGDSAGCTIKVINNSKHSYGYVAGSFKVYTDDTRSGVGKYNYVSGAAGFDGLPILSDPKAGYYNISRTGNEALQKLYKVSLTSYF